MKYMSFNSSCAFAGVANMLFSFGIDVQDRDIALGMKLPYLFAREENTFLAGPMLQSADWFNLYLHTIGFEMMERFVPREEIPERLAGEQTAMLGIRVSPRDKHAVVYIGKEGGLFRFLNNKWQHTEDPETFLFTPQELLSRLDKTVVIATLHPCPARNADIAPLLHGSCAVLMEMKEKLAAFCAIQRSTEEMMAAMNTLFRPVLLDGITMLELIGKTELASRLRMVQSEFMNAVRNGKTVALAEVMQMDVLMQAIDDYIYLIDNQEKTI